MSKEFGHAKEQSLKIRPHSCGGTSSKYHNGRTSLAFSDLFRSSQDAWRSSTKYIDPGYGYERDWRSSRGSVKGGGDSHLARTGAPLPLDDNWRSSIRYIDPGRDSLSSEGWRASTKVNQPKCGQEGDSHWRPGIRVFKPAECHTERKVKHERKHVTAVSHDEPFWHTSRGSGKPPTSKWSPPFGNTKSTAPDTKDLRKKVPSYNKKHPRLQLFPEVLDVVNERTNPMKPNNKEVRAKIPNYTRKHPHLQLFPETVDVGSERPNAVQFPTPQMREIRAKVAEYFKSHPPLHLFSASSLKPDHGKTNDEPNGDSGHATSRQYIPEGHNDHFENPACVPKASTVAPSRPLKMWCATGAQHDTAICRNVITGRIGPNDDYKPPKVTLGPGLFAPAANYNRDIIYGRFSIESLFVPKIPDSSTQLLHKGHGKDLEVYS